MSEPLRHSPLRDPRPEASSGDAAGLEQHARAACPGAATLEAFALGNSVGDSTGTSIIASLDDSIAIAVNDSMRGMVLDDEESDAIGEVRKAKFKEVASAASSRR